MKTVKVKCPAKLNLYLDITHRMPNGYHIMEMVMQAVNLFDTVYLTLNDTGEVTLSMEDSPIPADQTNIAWRCARLLLDETKSRHGVEIRIPKAIPSEPDWAAAVPMAPESWWDSMRCWALRSGRNA